MGVRVANGSEYRAKRGVISSIDAKRLFLHLMDSNDVDAADPNLRDRLERRIVNHNEAILKIDCALDEPLRFEHHHHQDEYLIGSVQSFFRVGLWQQNALVGDCLCKPVKL